MISPWSQDGGGPMKRGGIASASLFALMVLLWLAGMLFNYQMYGSIHLLLLFAVLYLTSRLGNHAD